MSAKSFEYIFTFLPVEYQDLCRNLYLDNQEIFDKCPGSAHNHQAWPGGYSDHLFDLTKIAQATYRALSNIRPLGFNLEDAVLSLFLHDLEKPWKYCKNFHFSSDEERLYFIQSKLDDYQIKLRPEHINAIKYAHGEGKDYRSDTRIQTPLAAFVHCCDVISARIWFDKA